MDGLGSGIPRLVAWMSGTWILGSLAFVILFHNIPIGVAGPGVFPGDRPARQEHPALHGQRMQVAQARRQDCLVCRAEAAVGRRRTVCRQRLPLVARLPTPRVWLT